jgi:hypothetical protein
MGTAVYHNKPSTCFGVQELSARQEVGETLLLRQVRDSGITVELDAGI